MVNQNHKKPKQIATCQFNFFFVFGKAFVCNNVRYPSLHYNHSQYQKVSVNISARLLLAIVAEENSNSYYHHCFGRMLCRSEKKLKSYTAYSDGVLA